MEKANLINTFISGVVIIRMGKEHIYCKPPSAEDKAFADFFAQEQYEDALINGTWTKDDAEQCLVKLGYWDDAQDKKINETANNIENMKIDYFNHFYNTQKIQYIKTHIKKQEETLNKLHALKHTFYDKTCEYIKAYAFQSHLLEKYAFFLDGGLAIDRIPINRLFTAHRIQSNIIDSRVREISKSNEWRNYWSTLKDRVFSNLNLTEFQLSLIGWSSYYDGIYQSMERPSDDIINDDIAIDGWAISERRKRVEEDKKRNAEKMLPDNLSDANEVFIPVKNMREQQDVLSLNDGGGRAKIKSLKRDLETRGSLSESDLTSTRQEMQMQSAQMSKNSNRRR